MLRVVVIVIHHLTEAEVGDLDLAQHIAVHQQDVPWRSGVRSGQRSWGRSRSGQVTRDRGAVRERDVA